jgi:predicted DNA-binding protein with PD1-like motif
MTSFKSIKTDVANAGAKWEDSEVVVDEGVITSRNPGDLEAFSAKIIEEVKEGRGVAVMKSRKIAGDEGAETRVVILETGEEAFAALTKFATDAQITAASLTAIGAFERATVGWFDFEKKTYKKIEVDEQCEVLSAIGDVAVGDDGKASLHVHVVLGLSDGTTRGGHLLEGKVRPTLEVVLTDAPAHLRRKKRADIGIALIDLGAEKR